jgi:hypothetical protein
MTRCLGEKAFLMLSAGSGSSEQRLHLETCELCGERYQRIVQELEFVASALRQEPSDDPAMSRPVRLLYKAMPIAAAFLFAALLIWGESRLWRSDLSPSSARLATNDVSDFIEQVSEALFPAEALGQTEVPSTDSDFVSLQNALGENCAADCQELFAELIDDRQAAPEANN